MDAYELLKAGRFAEAIETYRSELASDPANLGLKDGLATAYMEAGRYEEAIPLKLVLHEVDKAEVSDHAGQHLYLAVAYWCLENQARAIELVRGLCAAILDGSVSMAPDHAGGATFGLILHYMALTAGDDGNRHYALRYLRKLNAKYDKRPTLFRYPKQTVKQVLGESAFEDALEGASSMCWLRSLEPASWQLHTG